MEQEIKNILNQFWDDRAVPLLEPQDSMAAICTVVSPLDSFSTVHALAELDGLLGLRLPCSLVKNGGYQTKEEFLAELTSSVLKYMETHNHG